MQKPFTMSDDMLKELANEVSEGQQETHDAAGTGPSSPRMGRRLVDLQDRGSASSRSQNNLVVDPINPAHYKNHPSGVECITVTEWMNFNLGNAIKYIWRAGDKGFQLEDLKKAKWYLEREINRLEKVNETDILGGRSPRGE